jgi:type III secretory pathway component EscV
MTRTAVKPVQLEISITGGKAFVDGFDPGWLGEQMTLTLDDLAYPAVVGIETHVSDDLAPDDFLLVVDGRSYPRCLQCLSGVPEDTPARRIMLDLHANLDHVLTPSLAQALWRSWTGADEPPPDTFVRLLRRLARYRLRADRIAGRAAEWADNDPEMLFEEALSDASHQIDIEIHPANYVDLASDLAKTGEMIPMMMDGLFYELGIYTGRCVAKISTAIARDEVRIRVNDVTTPPLRLIEKGTVLVNDTVDRLTLLNVNGRKAFNPANGNECAVVSSDAKDICEQAGVTTWTPAGCVVLLVSRMIRESAPLTISLEMTEFYMDKVQAAFPVLARLVQSSIGVRRVAGVLRSLLEEEISIRNLPMILDRLLTLPPSTAVDLNEFIVFTNAYDCIRPFLPLRCSDEERAVIEMAECVRMTQRRYISHKYTRGQNTLIVYLLDPKIEKRLANAQPLTTEESHALLRAVELEIESLPPTTQSPVMLTTASLRYRCRQELRGAFPKLAVLSYQELSPDMNIQPIARITYPD